MLGTLFRAINTIGGLSEEVAPKTDLLPRVHAYTEKIF
jgi:hypothetical protein